MPSEDSVEPAIRQGAFPRQTIATSFFRFERVVPNSNRGNIEKCTSALSWLAVRTANPGKYASKTRFRDVFEPSWTVDSAKSTIMICPRLPRQVGALDWRTTYSYHSIERRATAAAVHAAFRKADTIRRRGRRAGPFCGSASTRNGLKQDDPATNWVT